MIELKDFIPNFELKNPLFDFKSKIEYINQQIKNNEKFICITYKEQISFFDLTTIDASYKMFYHIPFNSLIDLQSTNLSFQSKLELKKLVDILVFYKIDIEPISENQITNFLIHEKIGNFKFEELKKAI